MVRAGQRGVEGEHAEPDNPFLRGRLRGNPALRREVEAARAANQPRSVLLGRSVRTVTEHEHDDNGRLIRSVATTEPLWTDEDRDLLLALLAEEAEECTGCGQPLAQTTDPANRGTYEVSK